MYTHGTRTSVNIHTDSSQQNTPSSSLKNNSNRERKKEPFKYKDYLQSEMFVVSIYLVRVSTITGSTAGHVVQKSKITFIWDLKNYGFSLLNLIFTNHSMLFQ